MALQKKSKRIRHMFNTLAQSCRDGLGHRRVDAAKANHTGDDALQ
jgi:hypothetical protein